LCLLRRGCFDEFLFIPSVHFPIEPRDAARKDTRQVGVLAGQKIDELGCAGVQRTARLFIGRYDDFGKLAQGGPFMGRECLDLVWSSALLGRSSIMDVLSSLSAERGLSRRQRESDRAQSISTGAGLRLLRHCPSSFLRPCSRRRARRTR